MKWLKSTTQKSYNISGRLIPQCVTENNDALALSDSDYADFAKIPVVKSLIAAGSIIALDTEPTSPSKQASELSNRNAQLIMENTQLKEELAALKDGSNAADITALQNELASWQKKYAELEAEANETIAQLKAQIANEE